MISIPIYGHFLEKKPPLTYFNTNIYWVNAPLPPTVFILPSLLEATGMPILNKTHTCILKSVTY
eukprot:8987919-Karenia_brevis.AAC.1